MSSPSVDEELKEFLATTREGQRTDLSKWLYLLEHAAKTGEVKCSWELFAKLMCLQLYNVLADYVDDFTQVAYDGESYDTQYRRMVSMISGWETAPFTTQRLCELLTSPKRHYSLGSKYLLATTRCVYGIKGLKKDPEPFIQEDDMLYFDEDGQLIQIVNDEEDPDVVVVLDENGELVEVPDPLKPLPSVPPGSGAALPLQPSQGSKSSSLIQIEKGPPLRRVTESGEVIMTLTPTNSGNMNIPGSK